MKLKHKQKERQLPIHITLAFLHVLSKWTYENHEFYKFKVRMMFGNKK